MKETPPPVGQAIDLEPGLRRILAPNASPMTYWGTNTYLIGNDSVAVIDPGPDDPAHIRAILAATNNGKSITHIVVTHAHVDHSLGVRPLAEATGAPIYAYGTATTGQSKLMARLVTEGLESGGEGIDADFAPDRILADGDTIETEEWSLTAIWTPGHLSNHICLAWNDSLFSGDHVMGWATSIVSPPDGDLGAFMASCERLAARNDRIFYPGHGNPVLEPQERTRWLIDHRKGREQQILEHLAHKSMSPQDLVELMYSDVPKSLFGAAKRNVFAHLIDLTERKFVEPTDKLSDRSIFMLASEKK